MINRKEKLVQIINNGFRGKASDYPVETKYAHERKVEDYTIYGSNTGGAVGDITPNLFNYTEPLSGAFTADDDGWYDVTIDNTSGTDVEYVNCWTSVSGNLKASTLYYVCAEISKQSGDINYFLTQSSSDDAKGQFLEDLQNVPSGYITTRDDFSDCTTMLKSCCYCEAGKSGHIKFRIGVYECLPSEYREVEYIESTGTQYIDTLIDGNDVYGYDIKYQSTGIMTLKSPYLDGIMGINATPIDTKLWFSHPDNASAVISPALRSYLTYNTAEQRPVYSLQEYYATIWNVRVDIEKNYTLNGVSMGKMENFKPAQYDVRNIYLFAVNNVSNSDTGALYHSKTRMFNAKFYGETGELIRNFVPCYRVSDSVIGMYDTVGGVFYTNSGTGTFLKGANKMYEFEPYNKYKIPILNNNEIVANIYLDAPIAQGEKVNYRTDNLPDIYLKDDVNVLRAGSSIAPKKLSMTYISKVKNIDIPQTTVSGYPIRVDDVLVGERLVNYAVYGNSEQETRSGKNLLHADVTARTLNGVTLTYDDGVITLNGTCTASANFDLRNIALSANTYTLSVNANKVPINNTYAFVQLYDSTNNQVITVTNSNAQGYTTVTTSVDGNFLYRVRIDADCTYDNVILQPQLEVGSTATSYEQYGAMPSPEYPSEIESVGDLTTKNLIPYPYYDTTLTEKGVTWTDNGDGSITASGTATDYSDFLILNEAQGVIQPNKQYTFSHNDINAKYVATDIILYDKDRNRTRSIIGKTKLTITFTTAENEELITIIFKRGATGYSVAGTLKPQLELGTTATEYEPYHKYKIPIVSRGKNLFDISNVKTGGRVTNNGNGSLTVSGGATSADGGAATLQAYCPDLKVGDVVTLNAVATADVEIPNNFRRIYIYGIKMGWSFGTSKTITQEMLTGGRVGWYFAGNDESGEPIPATISNIQIEYGTTATEYEPYIPPVTTNIYLDEPLRKVDNYADYIDFENQKVVRKNKSIKVTADELKSKGGVRYQGVIEGISFNGVKKGSSNIGSYENNYALTGAFHWYSSFTNPRLVLVSPSADMTLGEYFTSIGLETDVEFVYILATPIEESIDIPALPMPSVKSINVSTNTSVQPSSMKLTYYQDV